MKLPFDWNIYFSVFFAFAIEMSVSTFLLTPEKKAFRYKPYIVLPLGFLISIGGSFLVFFIDTLLPWNAWVNIVTYLVLFCLVFVSSFLVYKLNWAEVLLRCVVAYTMQHMCYQLLNLFYDTGVGQYLVLPDPTWSNVLSNGVYYGLKIGFYVAFYFALCRPYQKYCRFIFRTGGVLIIAVIEFLLINAANVLVNQFFPGAFFPVVSAVISFLLIWCCILMDGVVLYCFRIVEKQEEASFLKADYQARIEAVLKDQESVAFINMKCHDLRKKIRFIKNNKDLLSDDDLNQIEEALRIYDTGMKSGNRSLDLFLQSRALYCRSQNIELTSLVDGSLFEKFDQNDIFFLLMNLLDNAVEAAEKVKDPAKRTISLTTAKKQGYVLIEERNYYVGEIQENRDGSLKSSKPDAEMHGYGFKSIQRIVKKYGGSLSYRKDGGIFELNIVL